MLLRILSLIPYTDTDRFFPNRNVDRALQSAAQELERQRATDSLRKGLEKRPEREELIERRRFAATDDADYSLKSPLADSSTIC